jgi:NAD dependent epimerase/dehydratase family enzyme
LTHLAFSSSLAGPVNLTAPNPVTNQEFVGTLGSVLRRPAVLPTPSLALKAMLGSELADALLFQSQRVVPARLIEDGFTFDSPALAGAMRSVLD